MKWSRWLGAIIWLASLDLNPVDGKAIYDIHASERLNASELFMAQQLRGVTNGRLLAGGSKKIQPPKAIAAQIVEGKRKRGSPVDTAWKTKRSAPPVSSCGMLWVNDIDTFQILGFLNYGPSWTYKNPIAFVNVPLAQGNEVEREFDMPLDVSGIFRIQVEESNEFLGHYIGATWRSADGSTDGPFDLVPGSTK
ncbi:hypothetical protein SISSUDRAFT_1050926 [Sistotremastrum suecicum HHB10207 ss-3]|uniref:Uncharacterized protein n=1 Tax=Sistotremastrum suecicum HHB10207 ss-3 TaxID=1314776 RepID=A0A166AVW6_9AGAM|nr:hypothetical protein SISSUDRAFT_1050926 [Sistotremastrum suecicum HHB10207 ss-3]